MVVSLEITGISEGRLRISLSKILDIEPKT